MKYLLTQHWEFVLSSLSREVVRNRKNPLPGDPYEKCTGPARNNAGQAGGVISQLKGHRQWEKSTAAMDGEVVMAELAALLTPQHFWGLGLGLTHFGSKSTRDWTGNAKWTWNPPVTSSGARGHQDYYPHWGLRDPSKQRSHTEAVIATSLWSFSHTLNNSMNRVSLWEENSTKLCRDVLRNCTTTITGIWNDFPRLHLLSASRRESNSIKTLMVWIWQCPKSAWVKWTFNLWLHDIDFISSPKYPVLNYDITSESSAEFGVFFWVLWFF